MAQEQLHTEIIERHVANIRAFITYFEDGDGITTLPGQQEIGIASAGISRKIKAGRLGVFGQLTGSIIQKLKSSQFYGS